MWSKACFLALSLFSLQTEIQTLEESQFTRNPIIPTRSSCGFQTRKRTLGGDEIGLEEFPWMVLLEYTRPSGDKRWSCAGSLISPRYVLTVASCVTGDISLVGKITAARLGEYNTETKVDCTSPEECNEAPVDVGIEEILPHPDYSKSNRNHHNDIALIRLNRTVTYSKFIQPICLPEPNESAATGERLTAVGWGRTVDMSFSTVKHKVEVPIVDKEQCQLKYTQAKVEISDSQICAGGEKGKDVCQGDSGAPLMKPIKSDLSQWYQEGIVSFGYRMCGVEGQPSVYTRVGSYLKWIHSTVRE